MGEDLVHARPVRFLGGQHDGADTGRARDEARQPVEVVNAALVLDPEASGQKRGEVPVSQEARRAAHHPQGVRCRGGDHHVHGGPHRHTAGQRHVLDVGHGELALFVEHGRQGEGGQGGGTEPYEGVDHCSVLVVTLQGQGGVE